jgi:hypothetical protein
MTLLFYLGLKVALTCTILVGSLASICMTLASSFILKMSNIMGMAGLSGAVGI